MLSFEQEITMDDTQKITKAKGRPMLQWTGKKPLEKVEYFPAQEKEVYGDKSSKEFNKLFWGDNLQVLSHLLKEYRGKIDLIYIDPPFDSKADYIKKVKLRGLELQGQQQNLIEEKQYTDIWENDEYLQFMYERLLLLKELLSDEGSIYLHVDWHRNSYLRLILDEVFGENSFVNEIIWTYNTGGKGESHFHRKHDTIYWYSKLPDKYIFDRAGASIPREIGTAHLRHGFDEKGREYYEDYSPRKSGKTYRWYVDEGVIPMDVWNDVGYINPSASERTDFPTQKPESLLERIIKTSSKAGGIVIDCFCGSGTTLAVAQKLGRKWIGCDINIGAVQTTTKRLGQIINQQIKEKEKKLVKDEFKGLLGFKVYNVNDYDVFKNEIEAKEIVMEMYGVEPIKRVWFDGELDGNFVKVMPLNRILSKLDIKNAIKGITDNIDAFTPKTTSKAGESVYEEGVILICSGAELDTLDYLKKENNTGVDVTIRDILRDKKNLIFKQKPEARVEVKVAGKKLTVKIGEFHSPILMRKIEVENEKIIDKNARARVEDFKQIIDSVAVDVDYDGQLFNAEIIDLPDKKDMIKAEYSFDYDKAGDYSVAIKIVDVLGEEYFETFKVKSE